eukprot:8834648-Alexandrium_andersonii.AAC.1
MKSAGEVRLVVFRAHPDHLGLGQDAGQHAQALVGPPVQLRAVGDPLHIGDAVQLPRQLLLDWIPRCAFVEADMLPPSTLELQAFLQPHCVRHLRYVRAVLLLALHGPSMARDPGRVHLQGPAVVQLHVPAWVDLPVRRRARGGLLLCTRLRKDQASLLVHRGMA